MPTIADCLKQTSLPRLEAQVLLSYVFGKPRIWLIAHDDELLDTEACEAFSNLCKRREAGEPIAYLVGEREFMGLNLKVSPAVLIPRPETELLVETALKAIEHQAAPAILDLGTGSGAIALAIKQARPDADVWATDIREDALAIARTNAKCQGLRLGIDINFLCGSWFDPLRAQEQRHDTDTNQHIDKSFDKDIEKNLHEDTEKHGDKNVERIMAPELNPEPSRLTDSIAASSLSPTGDSAHLTFMTFDAIVSNPPYIRAGDVHLSTGDLRFEPAHALTDGRDGHDGLEAYRTICAQAGAFLKSGAQLWFEHGFDQAEAVRDILVQHGFANIKTLHDLAGHPRVTGGFYNRVI